MSWRRAVIMWILKNKGQTSDSEVPLKWVFGHKMPLSWILYIKKCDVRLLIEATLQRT